MLFPSQQIMGEIYLFFQIDYVREFNTFFNFLSISLAIGYQSVLRKTSNTWAEHMFVTTSKLWRTWCVKINSVAICSAQNYCHKCVVIKLRKPSIFIVVVENRWRFILVAIRGNLRVRVFGTMCFVYLCMLRLQIICIVIYVGRCILPTSYQVIKEALRCREN